MDKWKRMEHKGKLLYCFDRLIQILSAPPTLLLVHRGVVLKIFFYLPIFPDKNSLDVIILPLIWFLKFLLLSPFHLVFLSTTHASLPPGVMFLNRRVVPH